MDNKIELSQTDLVSEHDSFSYRSLLNEALDTAKEHPSEVASGVLAVAAGACSLLTSPTIFRTTHR